jgi:phospholipid/cholesterol/gamma-HCH transport system substrate-binding protein
VSFKDNQGIERLVDYLYFQVQAINGFDTAGHFLRAGLIVNTCSTYAVQEASECRSKFIQPTATRSTAGAKPTGDPILDRTAAVLAGAKPQDVLPAKQQESQSQSQPQTQVPDAQTSTDLMDFLFGGAKK